MSKKEKIVKASIKDSKPAKNGTAIQWEDPAEYRNLSTGQMMPARSDFVNNFFFEFYKQAEQNEKLLFLKDYLKTEGIPKRTWHNWKDKSELRKELHFEAMEHIGCRRERGALERKYAEKTIHYMMPHYSEEWAEQQAKQAKLGIVDEKPTTINLQMTSYKEEESEKE